MPNKSLQTYKLKRNTEERIKTPKTPLKGSYIDISRYENDYEIIEKIGSGDYCDVYLVRHKIKNKERRESMNGLNDYRNDKNLGSILESENLISSNNTSLENNINTKKLNDSNNKDLENNIYTKTMNDSKTKTDLLHKNDECIDLKCKTKDSITDYNTLANKNYNAFSSCVNVFSDDYKSENKSSRINQTEKIPTKGPFYNCFDDSHESKRAKINDANSVSTKSMSRNSSTISNTRNISLPFYRHSFSTIQNTAPHTPLRPFLFQNIFTKNYCHSDTLSCIKILTKKQEGLSKTREIDILTKLKNHPHILQLKNSFIDNNLAIETEFCGFGTLKQLITKIYIFEKSKFNIQLIYKIMYELTNALCYIHSKNVIHMDLKPENVFIKSGYKKCEDKCNCYAKFISDIKNFDAKDYDKCDEDTLKNYDAKNTKDTVKNYDAKNYDKMKNSKDIMNIGDQTMKNTEDTKNLDHDQSVKDIDNLEHSNSKQCDPDNISDTRFTFVIGDFNISIYNNMEMEEDGDKKYMPPEILLNQARYESDIYSLGLMFLELITGIELPSKGSHWMSLRKNCFGKIKWNGVDKKDKSICTQMIDKDWKKRIGLKEVKKYFEMKCNKK